MKVWEKIPFQIKYFLRQNIHIFSTEFRKSTLLKKLLEMISFRDNACLASTSVAKFPKYFEFSNTKRFRSAFTVAIWINARILECFYK